MDKLLYTKKPLKPKTTSEEEGVRYVQFARDWECGEKESGHEGRRGGLVQYFYGFFLIFFIPYFIFSASKTPLGIFLLFMPRLFFKKQTNNNLEKSFCW